MSEQETKSVIYLGIETRYMPPTEEYIGSMTPSGWGLPNSEVVNPVGRAILEALAANDIDPATVVLSGYARSAEQEWIDEYKDETYGGTSDIADNESKITLVTQEMQRLYDEGILSQKRRSEMLAEIKELRTQSRKLIENAALPKKVEKFAYFFADHVALVDNFDLPTNPLYYAGGDEDATVGVYDRSVLDRLSEESLISRTFSKQNVYQVDTTRQELESAKVMEVHINYEVEAPDEPLEV